MWVSHNAFLIAALTKMRSTSGSSAAALMTPAWASDQCARSTDSPSSATILTADISSRSSRLIVWSGIGVSQTSASRPTWCEAWPVSIGPPRGWEMSPTRMPFQTPSALRLAREALEEGDHRRIAPHAVARQPHHLPRLAVDRQRPGAGEAAARSSSRSSGSSPRAASSRGRTPASPAGSGSAGLASGGRGFGFERSLVLRERRGPADGGERQTEPEQAHASTPTLPVLTPGMSRVR